MRPMPMMPSRLPQMRWPSIQVGDQPGQCCLASFSSAAPSASRRGTARMRAMVMSAVSSVSTPGVLVTMMPRTRAVSRSMLSTPLPKLAISFNCGPAWDSKERSILSVTVGTRTCATLTASAISAWLMGLSAQGTPARAAGASGLPVPRFVSLKSDRVNLRQGPGTEYPTAWVFRRAGLPVEVVKEFESWRQVRDAEGTTGWVLGSMLSGRRTAVILPWEVKVGQRQQTMAVLRDDDSARAGEVAQVEAGVLASIISCDGKWCRVSVGGFRGYIEQVKLWGAYKDEVIK